LQTSRQWEGDAAMDKKKLSILKENGEKTLNFHAINKYCG
jgi:hypothetical protein